MSFLSHDSQLLIFGLSSIGFFGAAISLAVTSKSGCPLSIPSKGVADLELTVALGTQIGLCRYLCFSMSVLSMAIKGGVVSQNVASKIGARSFDSPSLVLS